jgi:uncharacterized protein (DUF433 family)
MSDSSRITRNPAICHGRPIVRGLRYPVEVLLDLLRSGMSFAEILSDFEDLENEDLEAVVEWARERGIGYERDPLT